MTTKAQSFFHYAVIFCLLYLVSCGSVSTDEGKNQLRSDGYVQYSVNGQNIVIADSIIASDPALLYLYGYYTSFDSTLQLSAGTFEHYLKITLLHCRDTGIYLLGDQKQSYGMVETNWSTDSTLPSQFHLTLLDTVQKIVNGTFSFRVVDLGNRNNSTLIEGTVSKFPIGH